MKKKAIALLLAVMLLTNSMLFNIVSGDDDSISLGGLKEKFDTALDVSEAASYLLEGDIDKFTEIMAGIGIDTLGEMALGSLFSAGTILAETTMAITNWALEYNIENRFQEYREKRFASILSIENLTARDVREWMERGRSDFEEYWDTNVYNGPLRIKYINEIKERRLEDYGYTKWLWAKLNPNSKEAQKYNSVMSSVISEETIRGYIADDWEKAVLTEALNKLPKLVRQANERRLNETDISIRGYLEFDKNPDAAKGLELIVETSDKKEYKAFTSKALTERTNTFRFDIPIKDLKLKDSIKLIIKSENAKIRNTVAEIAVSKLLSVQADEQKEQNTGRYLKRYDAGTITISGEQYKETKLSEIWGIMPNGEKILLSLNNIIEFLKPSAPPSSYYKENKERLSNNAVVEYSNGDNSYYTITDIPEDQEIVYVQFVQPPTVILPTNANELATSLENENVLLKSNKISVREFNNRYNQIYSSSNAAGISSQDISNARNNALNSLKAEADAAIQRLTDIEQGYTKKNAEMEERLNGLLSSLNNMHMYVYPGSAYMDSLPVSTLKEMLASIDSHKAEYLNAYNSIVILAKEIQAGEVEYYNFVNEEKKNNYGLFNATNKSYTFGSNMRSVYFSAINSYTEENMRLEEEKIKARYDYIAGLVDLITDNSQKVAKALKDNYEQGLAFENYRKEKLENYINSMGTNLEKDISAISYLLGTATDYFRCVRDNIPDGIELWGSAFRGSMPAGMLALNRLNMYFGGGSFNEEFITQNSTNVKLLLPLLTAYKNMTEILYSSNRYFDKNYDILSPYDESNSTFKWLYLSTEIPANTSDYNYYVMDKFVKETMPDINKINSRISDYKYKIGVSCDLQGIINGILSTEDAGFYSTVQIASGKDTDNHWAKNDIENMLAKGYIINRATDVYEPDMPISREEFCQFIVLMLGIDTESPEGVFNDVQKESEYASYIEAAYRAGIVSGTGSGMFSPKALITREQMAKMVYKAIEAVDHNKALLNVNTKDIAFPDSASISSWALEYAKVSAALGIIKGRDDGSFSPADNASRAEAAVIIKRLAEKLGK